jgi:hypothetical protein
MTSALEEQVTQPAQAQPALAQEKAAPVATEAPAVVEAPPDKKGFIGRVKGKVKDWWQKGKDDPNTEEREDQTVEVTKFMGGMTRQELGMFMFEWGGLMMANSDQGFGAAMGQAGLGAVQGHRGRAAAEKEAALEDRRVGAQEMTAQAALNRSEEGKKPNIQWTKDGGVVVQATYDKDGNITGYEAVPIEDAEGMQIEAGLTPGSKQGQFRDQWMYDTLIGSGYTAREAADIINGAPTEPEAKLIVQRIWLNYDDRDQLKSPLTGETKPKSEFSDAEMKAWINEQVTIWSSPRQGALPPPDVPGNSSPAAGKDAVDQYDEGQ